MKDRTKILVLMAASYPLKKILVPTDLSDLSEHALRWADRIVEKSGGEIHALKIIEPPGEMLFDPEGDLLEVEEYDIGQLELERKSDEEGMAKWVSHAKNPVVQNVRIGRLIEDILRYVRENGIDLIVMGTHGTQGTWEWLAGSVAEKVVRYSEAPVLSVKGEFSKASLERLLLASDFEDPELRKPKGALEDQVYAAASDFPLKGSAREAIGVVKALQELFDAELHLIRIVQKENQEERRVMEQAMDRFAEVNGLRVNEKHIEHHEDVEEGVLAFAEREGMDLLAIGTHGRSGWGHLFRSSISEDLVDHLPFPVLTYHLE